MQPNINKSLAFGLLVISIMFVSCSGQKTALQPQSQPQETEKIKLPAIKGSTDFQVEGYDPIIISLEGKNDVYFGKDKIAKESLKTEIEKRLKEKNGRYAKTVFIKADRDISYKNFVEIIKLIPQNSEIDIGLVGKPFNKESVSDKEMLRYLIVKNYAEGFSAYTNPDKPSRPNPLTLVAALDKDGKFTLNRDEFALDALTQKLSDVFKYRESNGAFREGTNEIEKNIFIKAPLSAKYSEVMKLIDAVNLGGANPVCLQLENLVS